jgi:hypothetical protein
VIVYSRAAMRSLPAGFGFRVERCAFATKRINLDMLVRHATIHPHIQFGAALRAAGRCVPRRLLRQAFPFIIGEFYTIARKPAGLEARES